jgi:hypothetical protein
VEPARRNAHVERICDLDGSEHTAQRQHVRIAKPLDIASAVTQGVTALSFTSTSDARLKTNVQPLASVLDKVKRLNVKTFDKKGVKVDYVRGTEAISDLPAQPGIGFVAQELQDVAPELVAGDAATGYLGVKQDALLATAFVEYVAATDAEIAELKAKI